MNHIEFGATGEQRAAEYLSSAGYVILERNYHSNAGEIDIIAQQEETIVFVEVKTRRSTNFGTPGEAVNCRKQQKIIRTALCYLKHKNIKDTNCRIDVIEVYANRDSVKCNHIIDAVSN